MSLLLPLYWPLPVPAELTLLWAAELGPSAPAWRPPWIPADILLGPLGSPALGPTSCPSSHSPPGSSGSYCLVRE
ncbi:hypothetical protein BDP55DRAFT_681662 [Colletotrichum godetiae]|uniref:Secreted protein n=1 Tax=Colletotrichum godetiae TaxID=1209918 RepID=A0AAJ0A914_9PEZI|nr:uncharacterized protein BDP55DRAFT_681662 [Colletotrichum godetiae]KAK1658761.1 hypothetical protein BDP55DRAFT_681662 [Colletotrichum godetiae]